MTDFDVDAAAAHLAEMRKHPRVALHPDIWHEGADLLAQALDVIRELTEQRDGCYRKQQQIYEAYEEALHQLELASIRDGEAK